MTMTTNSLPFLEAFRLEEVSFTKRKVFPEEKKWPKALRKEFNKGNLDSHLPKKDLEVQIKFTSVIPYSKLAL